MTHNKSLTAFAFINFMRWKSIFYVNFHIKCIQNQFTPKAKRIKCPLWLSTSKFESHLISFRLCYVAKQIFFKIHSWCVSIDRLTTFKFSNSFHLHRIYWLEILALPWRFVRGHATNTMRFRKNLKWRTFPLVMFVAVTDILPTMHGNLI